MARYTKAQEREREAALAQAKWEAGRTPATLQDTRVLAMTYRSVVDDLATQRADIIAMMRSLARTLAQEADRLEQYPDREPDSGGYVLGTSLSRDIDHACVKYTYQSRAYRGMLRVLNEAGVTVPGVSLTGDAKDQFTTSSEG